MGEERKAMKWYEAAYIVMLIVLLVLSVSFLTPHRVAVLNTQKVIRETGVEQRISDELRIRQQAAVQQAAQLRDDVSKRAEDLSRQIEGAAAGEARDALRGELSRVQADYQKALGELGGEVQEYRREALLTFRERLQPYINKAARSRRLDVVVDPSSVLYVSGAMDITDLVIEKCREGFPASQPLVDRDLLKEKGRLVEPPAKPVEPPADAGEAAAAPAP